MTLLRMLAFRPAEAGTSSTPGPVAKPAAAKGAGQLAGEPEVSAQATNRSSSGGTSEAAKAARAAFDQLHKAGDDGIPVTLAAELALEPDATSEQAADEAGQDWASLQASLDLSGVTREFARNLQLEKRDEKRWKFLVPDALEQLGSKSVIRSLQSALSTHLGHDVTLDLHTETRPLESVAAVTERAELNRVSEAERAIDDDTTVKEIKEKFGANIVPDSIQPLQ
jgi:DNA polymerase-3 subunit gamma/tau